MVIVTHYRNVDIFCGIYDLEMSDFLNKAKEKAKEAAKEATDTITGQKDNASNLTDQAKEKAKEDKDTITGDQ
jgi:F0F1-type ATP synthase membrane subunit b/b'